MLETDNPNIVTQSHLGRVTENFKPDENMKGYLAVGKVIRVHHKSGTVDVCLVKSNDTITSLTANEGRFSARMSTSCAHFDPVSMTSSGVVEPVQEGQLVVLAFLEGLKDQPIILTSLHDTFEGNKNILTNNYPLEPEDSEDDFLEAFKYLRVFPSQLYFKVDGSGGIEFSHPSQSFLKITPGTSDLSDSHGAFTHKDLSENDPIYGSTRKGRTASSLAAIKYLFSHVSRKGADDSATHAWTKTFIDRDGTLRITRDNNDDRLSTVEMDREGAITICRKNDTHTGPSKNNTTLSISKRGEFSIAQTKMGPSVPLEDTPANRELQKNDKVKESTDTITSIDMGLDGVLSIQRTKGGETSVITVDTDNNIVVSSPKKVTVSGNQVSIQGTRVSICGFTDINSSFNPLTATLSPTMDNMSSALGISGISDQLAGGLTPQGMTGLASSGFNVNQLTNLANTGVNLGGISSLVSSGITKDSLLNFAENGCNLNNLGSLVNIGYNSEQMTDMIGNNVSLDGIRNLITGGLTKTAINSALSSMLRNSHLLTGVLGKVSPATLAGSVSSPTTDPVSGAQVPSLDPSVYNSALASVGLVSEADAAAASSTGTPEAPSIPHLLTVSTGAENLLGKVMGTCTPEQMKSIISCGSDYQDIVDSRIPVDVIKRLIEEKSSNLKDSVDLLKDGVVEHKHIKAIAENTINTSSILSYLKSTTDKSILIDILNKYASGISF